MIRALLFALILAIATSPAKAEELEFRAYDLFVETHDRPLAAWQIEVTAPGALLVGVEGGEAGPYEEPAHHDARALQNERVILAHFTLDDAPAGRLHLARLHFALEGDAAFQITIEAAADPHGQPILVDAELLPVPLESPEERR